MYKTIIIITTIMLSFLPSIYCQDTFSIVAIDPETGEIGAAGATCSDGIADFKGVQLINKVIPGKGVVNAQAWICARPNINLDYAIDQINLNRQAPEVLDSLLENDKCSAKDFDINFRQYGIITIDSISNIFLEAYTGEMASNAKGDRKGENYVIIGNNLTDEAVLDSMESRFIKQNGTLADKLLAAMQGGKSAGGDSRCSDRGTSSTSTFLRIAKPDDEVTSPYLYITIPGVPMGVEPIDSLQVLYDDFFVGIENSEYLLKGLHILVSPVNDVLHFSLDLHDISFFDVAVYDLSGLEIFNQILTHSQILHTIDLPKLSNGIYLLLVKTKAGFASKKFQVLK